MKIAARLYGHNHPSGIPSVWPAEIKENVESLPEGFDVLFDSVVDYHAYRATHQAAYDAWESAQIAVQPVPQSVTPWQMLCALNQIGLRNAVEAAVAAADQNTKDAWNRATRFPRNSPLLSGVATSAGMTEAQLDDLFRLADTFQ